MRFSKCKDRTGFCDRLSGGGHYQCVLLVGRF
jgi:hypothetical protein